VALDNNQWISSSFAISPSSHPFRKARQIKGVQMFQLVYATLVTLLTMCLPCSKSRVKMISGRRLAARLLAQVTFCRLSSNTQRRCISDHAVQCVPQTTHFLCGVTTAASSAVIPASILQGYMCEPPCKRCQNNVLAAGCH